MCLGLVNNKLQKVFGLVQNSLYISEIVYFLGVIGITLLFSSKNGIILINIIPNSRITFIHRYIFYFCDNKVTK